MLITPTYTVTQAQAQPWEQQLKKSLIKRCRAFIRSNSNTQEHLISKPKLYSNFMSHSTFKENHNYDVNDHGHGLYSEYVSVRSNQYQTNEFCEYFPFIRHLAQRHSSQYELNLFEISNALQNCKDHKQWMQVCQKYSFDLTIEETFYYHGLLLLKGIGFIQDIMKHRGLQCNRAALLFKIQEVRGFFHQKVRVNTHLTISIDKGEEITLENLSKTLKYLFCPICVIYDCQKHFLPDTAFKNNFQYVQEYDIRHRLQNRKNSAIRLFQQSSLISCQGGILEVEFCSEKCFKRLNSEKWQALRMERRKRVFSPVFKGLVKMGIELYDYHPCSIQALFAFRQDKPTKSKSIVNQIESSCEQIFYYFVQEFNLPQKMQYKFYASEMEQLLNESKGSACLTTSATPRKPMRKLDKTAKKVDCDEEYNSVCFHYFLDKEPSDVTCLSCDCQQRGYCLPSCGCSQLCQIRRAGCRCKGQSNCWENKCPCFKAALACLPETCGNCFACQEGQSANWCQNSEKAMHRGKLTRIGTSKIQGAGLGLFAGQVIFRGEFVMKYLGQVIDSVSLEKIRENLVENNLFYTFKLSKYQSVDSRLFGNKARFINHSKKAANVVPRAMCINEERLIVFHATRDIHPGEEIYFNYNGEGELSEFKQKFPFID